jgi:hypothetical protein
MAGVAPPAQAPVTAQGQAQAAVSIHQATMGDRAQRKRQLEAELETVRNQKAQVLRSIEQIAKKQKFVGNAVMGNSVEARIDGERRHHEEMKRKLWQGCTRIIADLLKNQNTRLYFGEPVRGDLYPGYYEIIKEPRDLGSIKRNLDSMLHYKNVYEFRDDVRLCFENCRMFNPQGHQVRAFGDAASNTFEKKWEGKRVEEDWESELQRHKLAMDRLEAEAKSLPEKIKEVDEELQALASKVQAEQQQPKERGPHRDMTLEEKRKLSHSITQHINAEQMGRIMEMIMEGPSAPQTEEGGDGEVEVDIDAIDKDTLWKIEAYVETIAAENAAKQPAVAPPAQQTVTATGETGAADSNQERTGEANAEGVGSGSEGMASNHQKKDGVAANAIAAKSDTNENETNENATAADGSVPMQTE